MPIWDNLNALQVSLAQSTLCHDEFVTALRHLTILTQYQFYMTTDRAVSVGEVERAVELLVAEIPHGNDSKDNLRRILKNLVERMSFNRDQKLTQQFLQTGERLIQKYDVGLVEA